MPPKRLDTDQVYLTFPQNDFDPKECLNLLVQREPQLKWAVVAQELHQDGQPHLHVLAKMKSRIRYNLNHFDYAGGGKHGNHQSAKFLKKCLAYVCKSGTYFAHGIDPAEFLKPSTKSTDGGGKMTDQVARAILQGATDAEITATHPGFVLLHTRQLSAFRALAGSWKSTTGESTKPVSVTVKPTSRSASSTHSIVLDGTMSQEFRSPAIWISGPTKTGKSSAILKLLENSRGFLLPYNSDFTLWADHQYDFAYCDEFHGQLTVSFLNEWIQGTHMHLNTKGSSVQKRHNLPTFILSNFSPRECFPKAAHLETLIGRLICLELEPGEFALDFLDIQVLAPKDVPPPANEGSQEDPIIVVGDD